MMVLFERVPCIKRQGIPASSTTHLCINHLYLVALGPQPRHCQELIYESMNSSYVMRIAEQSSPYGGVAEVLFDLVTCRVGVGENANAMGTVLPFLRQYSKLSHKKGGLAATRTGSYINAVHAFENFLTRISPVRSVKRVNWQTQQSGCTTYVRIRYRWRLEYTCAAHSQTSVSGAASTVPVT